MTRNIDFSPILPNFSAGHPTLRSPSGHQHLMVPVNSGALRYDLTNIITDLTIPLELIHWTKSSGHVGWVYRSPALNWEMDLSF